MGLHRLCSGKVDQVGLSCLAGQCVLLQVTAALLAEDALRHMGRTEPDGGYCRMMSKGQVILVHRKKDCIKPSTLQGVSSPLLYSWL